MIEQPIGVYLNWSSYDELSDTVELTEALAMRQLEELLRLRRHGVQLDYYVMDAFWFAKDGGYRHWRKPHWPEGPDRWLAACLANQVKPGMWFGANNPAWMHPIPEWMDSFDPQTGCMCCFYGGFLPHYLETLHLWYERGVRLFKFDFADFSAAPPRIKETLLPSEIRAANITAFRGALKAFRHDHPDVVLLGYNGFEERTIQNSTDEPLAKVIDTRWLEVFDSVYCGDARPADVPTMNFWRAKDIYSDHMVRRYEQNDVPLRRIDNAGFMIGTTGTCYRRGTAAWRGMLILSLARGGYVSTYYGNLDLLSDEDAEWFVQVQRLFFDAQSIGITCSFGGLPGERQPYGFVTLSPQGALIAVVNPSQTPQTLQLPHADAPSLLFTDSGFTPLIGQNAVTLGPEQMALLGDKDYAEIGLGLELDVSIPEESQPLAVEFISSDSNTLTADVMPLGTGKLRVTLEQKDRHGRAARSASGRSMGHIFSIEAEQEGITLPVDTQYDRVIWSGLSWAVGEIHVLDPAKPIHIRCSSHETPAIHLHGAVYQVRYSNP